MPDITTAQQAVKSSHAELLNELDRLQRVLSLAVYRGTLSKAETVIVQQEASLDRLRAELELARVDAARLDFIEANSGSNLVSDDAGRWGWSDSGMQPVPAEGGFTEMVGITSLVDPDAWKPSVRAAIDTARGRG